MKKQSNDSESKRSADGGLKFKTGRIKLAQGGRKWERVNLRWLEHLRREQTEG